MNLLLRAFAVAVVVIILSGAAILIVHNAPKQITEPQAVSNVTNYLHDAYGSSAIVNVTNVTPSQYPGSWHILAGVILNSTSPCPSYTVYSFEYPQYQFVSRVQNVYTEGCNVNETTIGSYPVAIARSYALNVSQARNFVNKYGYSNVVVTADHLQHITISGTNYNNVWEVFYNAPTANTSVQVYLDSNGTILTAT